MKDDFHMKIIALDDPQSTIQDGGATRLRCEVWSGHWRSPTPTQGQALSHFSLLFLPIVGAAFLKREPKNGEVSTMEDFVGVLSSLRTDAFFVDRSRREPVNGEVSTMEDQG